MKICVYTVSQHNGSFTVSRFCFFFFCSPLTTNLPPVLAHVSLLERSGLQIIKQSSVNIVSGQIAKLDQIRCATSDSEALTKGLILSFKLKTTGTFYNTPRANYKAPPSDWFTRLQTRSSSAAQPDSRSSKNESAGCSRACGLNQLR